jgi:hypothetical protein
MSILAMSNQLSEFCEKHDLYEYSLMTIVTMPDGYQFCTNDTQLANRFIRDHNAQTRHIVELGE